MKRFLAFFFLFVAFMTGSSFADDVTYEVAGEKYEGFVLNKGPQSGLVFLIHDWDGLTEYEKKRSQMLADQGYSVFAVDMYGKGVRPVAIKDRRHCTQVLYSDRAKMRSLMNGALAAAKNRGLNVSNAVVMGYCFGGTCVLEWAKSGADLKGFASFHGGLSFKEGENYEQAKAPIAIFHGTADTGISMQDFARLAVQLEKDKVPHEMITYSGAPHAFTVFGSDRYRKDADQKSWRRFLQFVQEQLK